MRSSGRAWTVVILVALVVAQGCAGGETATPEATFPPTSVVTDVPPEPTRAQPTATAVEGTPLPQPEPTALPSDLRIAWGEWWYEGEYLADADKYPADPVYHDRSFNIRVTLRNESSEILPGDVLPVFFLTDGDGERPVITWHYSQDDLRALKPGEEKAAVFRALTYTPEQWIARVEVIWRGQVWQKEFPKQ